MTCMLHRPDCYHLHHRGGKSSVICKFTRALYSFLSFAHYHRASIAIPLLLKTTIPALHFLPPPTLLWLYGTNPFSHHSQLYPFVTLLPSFSNTSSQELSLSFSRRLPYSMPLPHTTQFVLLYFNIGNSLQKLRKHLQQTHPA